MTIARAAEMAEVKFPGTVAAHEWYSYLSEHTHGSAALASDYLTERDGVGYTNPHAADYKAAPMAIAALNYTRLVFDGLVEMGLKYDPSALSDPLAADLSSVVDYL